MCLLGGALAGFPFFLYLFAYMALAVDFFLPPIFGYLTVILAALYSTFFFALFAAGLSILLNKGSLFPLTLGAPSLWVLTEWLRSAGLLGHTGGFLGYSQADYPFMLQSAALYGYWGLSFLMVLFHTIIFILLLGANRAPQFFKFGFYGEEIRQELIFPSVLFLFLLLCGLFLPSLFPVQERGEPLRAALFQGNIPQEEVISQSMSLHNFNRYIELAGLSAKVSEDNHVSATDLMVWPETVLTVANDAEAKQKLARLADETGAAILFGAIYGEPSTGSVYNSILYQTPGQTQTEWDSIRYDKIHLVPLAEYFPLSEQVNKLLKLEISLGVYTPGTYDNIPLFTLKESAIGGVICFESYFSRPALDLARQGAEHIFILSNNAWFLESNGLDQQARAAAIRAVETGLGVTQVANTGSTVSYDYRGRKILQMPLLQEGYCVLETTFPHRLTLYHMWGDYYLFVCFILLLLALFKRKSVFGHV